MVPVFNQIATSFSLTGHNSIRFDAQFAGHEDEVLCKKLIYPSGILQIDTMVMALLDDENRQSYKLENLCKEFNPRAGDEEVKLLEALARMGFKNKDAKKEMYRLPAATVEPYACGDLRNTRALYCYLLPRLKQQGLMGLSWEMFEYARLLARIQRTGLHMSRDRLVEQRAHTARLEQQLLDQIHKSAGFGINPRSPKQLGQWLNMESTAKEALKKSGDPRADILLTYRRAQKALSTYHDPILTRMDENDVIHPQLNMTRDPRDRGGTRSARLSCSDPNFQALPKKDAEDPLNIYGVKRCITPRPGRVLIGADYEKMEVIMAGAYSGDPYIQKMYEDGTDIYEEMAEDLDLTRDGAKTTFLSLQYGIGCFKLGQRLGCGETNAWYIRDRFRTRHAKIYDAMCTPRSTTPCVGRRRTPRSTGS
jgi:DNA polymerase-1